MTMNNPNTTILNLKCGPVIAQEDDHLIYARGIRYATAARFAMPSPARWTRPRDCTRPASICPQLPSRLANVNGDITGGRFQSEDCLHVTVAAPVDSIDVPVMVFFHGGGYMSGGGDLDAYNPCELARKGVVVVNVTSRVGHFGFLPIPGIAAANLGLWDLIEALKWGQHNVAAFGGDPSRVTLFGQSAGAYSIFCLLSCKDARGLFHRAILQSAPMGLSDEPEHERATMAAAMGEHALQFLSATPDPLSTKEYLNLQPKLLEVGRKIFPSLAPFGPVFGESPLPPRSEVKQLIQEVAGHISIMIGYTTDEGTAFADLAPVHDAAWYTKNVFILGSDRLHGDISLTSNQSPTYEFVWHPEGSKWGASHCIELPFLLGGYHGWMGAPALAGCDAKAMIQSLGSHIKNLWVAFARGDDLARERFVIDEAFKYR